MRLTIVICFGLVACAGSGQRAAPGPDGGSSVEVAGSGSAGTTGGAGAGGAAGGGAGGSVLPDAASAPDVAADGASPGDKAPSPDVPSSSDATATNDATAADSAASDGGSLNLPKFSFFVTSVDAIRKLSGNQKGFGGDLRFGKADGLAGADEICRVTAEMGLTGAGQKMWRAFLSVTAGPNGTPVNAIDRVGSGPWYDRLGRLVALNKADLAQNRPRGAAAEIINDLPNESGIPNGYPVPGQARVDNHHTLTGSKADGTLYSMNKGTTCNDWTSAVGSTGRPRCGVSWPRGTGDSWISLLDEGGCAPGYNLIEGAGPPAGDNLAVGANGGYGGIYCFALTP